MEKKRIGFFNFIRIAKIEEEIYQVKQEVFDLPNKLKGPITQSVFDGRLENAKKPLLHKLDMLRTEREFLLSKREAWLPKTVWNLVVPILVSVLTAIIVTKLDIK